MYHTLEMHVRSPTQRTGDGYTWRSTGFFNFLESYTFLNDSNLISSVLGSPFITLLVRNRPARHRLCTLGNCKARINRGTGGS